MAHGQWYFLSTRSYEKSHLISGCCTLLPYFFHGLLVQCIANLSSSSCASFNSFFILSLICSTWSGNTAVVWGCSATVRSGHCSSSGLILVDIEPHIGLGSLVDAGGGTTVDDGVGWWSLDEWGGAGGGGLDWGNSWKKTLMKLLNNYSTIIHVHNFDAH